MSEQGQARRSFVIGTAGHVDHGKSLLVRALTGTDPDRLAEEKARGMTIDLGFAHFRSPAGHNIGIVDVPGHERFIKNMLAGVGGIDAALLVVAADEGPMPQTREHLAILGLLGVSRGVVALTKRDLVDDDWLGYVTEDVREAITGSSLSGAEVVPVSSRTGAGLTDLQRALDEILASTASSDRVGHGVARLPIDRVFTLSGFGTVVTGTLLGGLLHTGDEVEIQPGGLRSRIRGIQSHGQARDAAEPGTRAALNLTGVDVSELSRGQVIARPGALSTSMRFDARVELLADAPPLKHNAGVDLFIGSAETPAKLSLLDSDVIEPGGVGWVQLRLARPVAALVGDRFVLRRPSPSDTIGGGTVVELDPPRHRRHDSQVLERLEKRLRRTPEDLVIGMLSARPMTTAELVRALGELASGEAEAAIDQLLAERTVVRSPSGLLLTIGEWEMARSRMRETLARFHGRYPLRRGMPREELRSQLKLPGGQASFDAIVHLAGSTGDLAADGTVLRLADFSVRLDPAQREIADGWLAALDAAPYTPQSPTEAGLDQETVVALLSLGEVAEAATDVYYRPDVLERIKVEVLAVIERDGKIALAQYRDLFSTSRKFAQATLEYLDSLGITRRVGDERVRGRTALRMNGKDDQ